MDPIIGILAGKHKTLIIHSVHRYIVTDFSKGKFSLLEPLYNVLDVSFANFFSFYFSRLSL